MKRVKLVTTAMLCGLITIASCDKQNGDGHINNDVYAAFEREFPGAKDVSWRTDGNYAIVSFEWSGSRTGQDTDYTAWFERTTAEFKMHEYDIPFHNLPQAVLSSFNESDYSKAPWKTDDEVDVIKRNGEEIALYVIEVEKKENGLETEADLYYSEDGIMVKEIIDAEQNPDYTDLLPSQPANNVYAWVESKYPGAGVVDVEFEDGGVEVEFIYKNIKHDALLTAGYEWIYTKKDYNRDSSVLPEAAGSYITTNYPDFYIDDIEYYETASKGNFFSVEIEGRHDNDMELYFDTTGNTMNSKPDFSDELDGGVTAGTDIQAFLDNKYPGAAIREKDYDDGLVEIEIIHEGIEKDVYFNGKNEWVRTEYEIAYDKLPDAVKNFIESNYTSHGREADVTETSQNGTWYEIEVRKNMAEYDVLVNEDGTLKAEYRD